MRKVNKIGKVKISKHGMDYKYIKVRDITWTEPSGKKYSLTISLRYGAKTDEPILAIFDISEGVKISVEDFKGIRGGCLHQVPIEELKTGGVYHNWKKILPVKQAGEILTEVE